MNKIRAYIRLLRYRKYLRGKVPLYTIELGDMFKSSEGLGEYPLKESNWIFYPVLEPQKDKKISKYKQKYHEPKGKDYAVQKKTYKSKKIRGCYIRRHNSKANRLHPSE